MSRPDLELLRDAIDMHAHTHPALFNRPIDDADLAQQAIDFGMRGVVLKDHDQATMGRAYHVSRIYPDHSILGEETGESKGDPDYKWIIDPIDGTKSFILGQHHWAILIALHDGTAPVVGVVHQPFVGETFMAAAGGPAQWRRGDERRTLRTRACPRIEDAIVATTDPRQFQTPAEQAALQAVSGRARFLRYGGDCYCYTQLAMGFVDVVIENGLQAYDVDALMPIVEAAGGVITNWSGGSCDQGGPVVACGDRVLHAEILRMLRASA